jgi:hypothetical protein
MENRQRKPGTKTIQTIGVAESYLDRSFSIAL